MSSRQTRRVLAVNADPAMLGLLEEWLAAYGCEVVQDPARGDPELIVVDVPFPRRGGLHVLKRLADEYPDTHILAMSSSFFPDVRSDGPVARALGVAGVLPKPLTRDALLKAVAQVLGAMR